MSRTIRWNTASFEGVIPKGQYGAGTVMLWDRGTWRPKEDPVAGYAKGHLKFELDGENLKGGFDSGAHARQQIRRQDRRQGWLLIKEKDEYARSGRAHRRDRAEQRDDRTEREGNRRGPHQRVAIQAVREGECEGRRHRQSQTGQGANRRQRRRARRAVDAMPNGAKAAALPAMLSPMLTTLVASAPTGRGLAARDQVRRLPDPLPDREGQGAAFFAQRQGLDGGLRGHRRRPREASGSRRMDRRRGGRRWTPRAAPVSRRCRTR